LSLFKALLEEYPSMLNAVDRMYNVCCVALDRLFRSDGSADMVF